MLSSRDPYEVVLADLRAKRDEIDQAIRAIEAVRPPAAYFREPAYSGVREQTQVTTAPASYHGLSIEEATRLELKRRGEPMRPAEIFKAISEGGLAMNSVEPANTISSVLNRGWRNGSDVVRVSRGTWALAEWYPERDTRYREDVKSDAASDADSDVEPGETIDPLAERPFPAP